MVIKQLLELTGAGPWDQKDGTFYLASLLSMNLCSKRNADTMKQGQLLRSLMEAVLSLPLFCTLLLTQTESFF